MTDLEKITNLIKSDDSSNWKLAFELSHLLDYRDKYLLLTEFKKKDSRLHYLKWQKYHNSGYLPITNGFTDSLRSPIILEIIKNLTKILENESGRTK